MTEFGTLEIVTNPEGKGQEKETNCGTLNAPTSHSPTPPPEAQPPTTSAPAAATVPQQRASQGIQAHSGCFQTVPEKGSSTEIVDSELTQKIYL